MTQVIASSELTAVIGMGATGLSVARFLEKTNQRYMMLDTRQTPPNLEHFHRKFAGIPCELGELSSETLSRVSRIVVSPGVSARQPAIDQARARGVPVLGDIQLFAEYADAPIVAITGSNGKSTVTTLLGEMLKAAGKQVAVGGNLGTPALDLLGSEGTDCYVVELSSFQLETTDHLNAEVATVLNVSADHMDRYRGLPDYHAAKQRVYFGARKIVINRDDPLTQPPLRPDMKVYSFGLGRPDLKQFGLLEEGGAVYLAFGLDKLMAADELKVVGRHNLANALAALAIGHALDLAMAPMLETLRSFTGLPHRCQWVATAQGVDFFNDSKGTNIGATVAALHGFSNWHGRIVLIAGGEGKGADFRELAEAMKGTVKALVTIGRDGPQLAAAADSVGIETFSAESMADAVELARGEAESGDAVLLSPACASFDMFEGYSDRGNRFVAAVKESIA